MSVVLNESYLTGIGTLDQLHLKNTKMKAELSQAVIGSPNLDLSAGEVSQLTLQILDPDLSIYASGLFGLKTSMSFGDHDLEVAASGVSGDSIPIIDVTARSAGVQKLRRQKGPQVVSNVSPTDYARYACGAAGLKFIGQDSARQAQIVRSGGAAGTGEVQDEESTWDVIQRLASEIGFIAFESRTTVYFGKPSWLIKRPGAPRHTVRFPQGKLAGEIMPLSVPTCRKSVDSAKNAVTVEVVVDILDALKMSPGDLLSLKGIPGFEADYMIDRLGIDIDGVSPVAVSASTPIDPTPQPPPPPDSYRDGSGSSGGGGGGRTLADAAATLIDVNSRGGVGLTVPPAVVNGGQRFIWPVNGKLGSRFGPRRSPGGIGSTNHQGIDISAGGGTRIVAAKTGTVIHSGWAGGYGNAVYLDHGGGLTSRYAHMKTIHVRRGDRVGQGQTIGTVNSTGNSTGNHLHFEIRMNGTARDPLPYLTGASDRPR